jgi:hypothetical protein
MSRACPRFVRGAVYSAGMSTKTDPVDAEPTASAPNRPKTRVDVELLPRFGSGSYQEHPRASPVVLNRRRVAEEQGIKFAEGTRDGTYVQVSPGNPVVSVPERVAERWERKGIVQRIEPDASV